MADLERIRQWLSTYPGMEQLQSLRLDYYDPRGDNSIAAAGLTEISRTEDVCGNLVIENRYSFGLYYTLAQEADALTNAHWILAFQQWVQQQDLGHLAPTFGDSPLSERISAGNGALYAADSSGTVTYLLLLTVNFKKIY